jgi:hypothetical protein
VTPDDVKDLANFPVFRTRISLTNDAEFGGLTEQLIRRMLAIIAPAGQGALELHVHLAAPYVATAPIRTSSRQLIYGVAAGTSTRIKPALRANGCGYNWSRAGVRFCGFAQHLRDVVVVAAAASTGQGFAVDVTLALAQHPASS